MKLTDWLNKIECRAVAADLSIDDLCAQSSINRSTYTRWKSGDTTPTFRLMQRIEGVLVSKELDVENQSGVAQ